MKISKDFVKKFGLFCFCNLGAAFIACYWLYAVANGELPLDLVFKIIDHPILFFIGIILVDTIMIGLPILGFFFARFLFRLVMKLEAKRK